jgi:hypothetical protein
MARRHKEISFDQPRLHLSVCICLVHGKANGAVTTTSNADIMATCLDPLSAHLFAMCKYLPCVFVKIRRVPNLCHVYFQLYCDFFFAVCLLADYTVNKTLPCSAIHDTRRRLLNTATTILPAVMIELRDDLYLGYLNTLWYHHLQTNILAPEHPSRPGPQRRRG